MTRIYVPSYSSICLYYKWAERHKKLYVFCLLIACFFFNFFYGSVYTWGNIQPYLVSYIRQRSSPSTLRYTESTYIYSTQCAGCAIGLTLGGYAETKLGGRMSILIGGIISSIGLFLSYYTIQYSFWLLFITFGVLYSVGSGIVHFLLISLTTQWVQKRTGLAIGFVTSGAAVGSLTFVPLQTAFINPNDEFPNDAPYEMNTDEKYFAQTDLIERVPFIFLIEGAILMLLTVVASSFISNPANHEEQKRTKTLQQAGKCHQPASFVKKLKNIFFLCSFYLHWLVAFVNIISFGVISSFYKIFGIEQLKLSDFFLTATGAVASGLFSIVGRLMFGFIADRSDYKISYVLQSGLMAIFLLTLYTTSLGYPIMYFIWVCCIFMCYGGYCTMVIIAVLRGLGKENFNFNFSMVVTTSQIVASFTYGVLSDYCLDSLGWSGTLLLIGCLTIAQTCLIMLFPEDESLNHSKKYTKNLLMFLTMDYN